MIKKDVLVVYLKAILTTGKINVLNNKVNRFVIKNYKTLVPNTNNILKSGGWNIEGMAFLVAGKENGVDNYDMNYLFLQADV